MTPEVRPKVGIVGLGLVGRASAQLALRSGYSVVGHDIDSGRVQQAGLIEAKQRLMSASTSWAILEGCEILIIAIRPGPAGLLDCATLVEGLARPPRLIIVTSTVKPGATRALWQSLSPQLRSQVSVVCCPERLREGDSISRILESPRLLGGFESNGVDAALSFLTSLGLRIETVSSAEVAELSKLVENAFLTVGISFITEVMQIAHAVGVGSHEVASAAATKRDGYYPFFPGAGIGGRCLPSDLVSLLDVAEKHGVTCPVLAGAEATANGINASVVDYLHRKAALQPGITVLLVGVGFKPGSADLTATPAIEIVTLLRARGCVVWFTDQSVERLEVDGVDVLKVSADECALADAVLLLAGDASVATAQLCDYCDTVVDIGGGRVMDFDSRVIRL